ncbi:hypothetical protein AN1V17_32630 [Vallitalea sediminicola]
MYYENEYVHEKTYFKGTYSNCLSGDIVCLCYANVAFTIKLR